MVQIKTAYVLNDEDWIQLQKYPFLDWDDSKYDKIKERIKDYYCKQQKQICAYCQIELEHKCHGDHIEHIVDKSQKPHWQLDPHNLALSCPECNTSKGVKPTLYNLNNQSLFSPRSGEYYRICHPHYDDYSDHIEFEDSFFIKPKNNHKGLNTIKVCKLYRSMYVDKRMRHRGISKEDRRIQVLNRLEKDISVGERNELFKYVDEILSYL